MLYVLRCIDRTDRPGLRQEVRPAHLDHISSLGTAVVAAGPLLADDQVTPMGSLIILEAADKAAAEETAARDPYAEAGLFESVTVTPFRLVFLNPPVV